MKGALLALFLSVLIVVGCKNDETAIIQPPAAESDFGTYDISTYVPMSIGNRWIYDYEGGVERAVLDRRVQDTLRSTGNVLMFRYSEDVLVNNPPPSQPVVGYFYHRGGTIYHGQIYGSTYFATLPILASPIAVGHRWWTDANGRRDSFEIVGVSPGQFNAQVIDTVVVVRRWSESLVDSLWIGRAVGILKQRGINEFGNNSRTLRTFTPSP